MKALLAKPYNYNLLPPSLKKERGKRLRKTRPSKLTDKVSHYAFASFVNRADQLILIASQILFYRVTEEKLPSYIFSAIFQSSCSCPGVNPRDSAK